MPKKLEPAYKSLPDAPGFWVDVYLTSYGCAVVSHEGTLYALGWAATPTRVDTLRPIPEFTRRNLNPQQRQETGRFVYPGGWYGPLPVPPDRRYEIRKLKDRFVRLGPDDV